MQIGWTFFGWGILLAVSSVWVAPVLQRWFGTMPALTAVLGLFALDLAVMAVYAEDESVVTACIVVGAFIGVNNTLVTEAVMGAAPVERPVASAAYSFVRFTGGALGPFIALSSPSTSECTPRSGSARPRSRSAWWSSPWAPPRLLGRSTAPLPRTAVRQRPRPNSSATSLRS